MATRALDASLAGCTKEEFCDGFPTIGESHREVLHHVYLQAQEALRTNTLVRKREYIPRKNTNVCQQR